MNLTFVSLILTLHLAAADDLSHDDLELLDASCSPRDTCALEVPSRNFYSTNCECDSSCAEYRDCCVDSAHRRRFRRISRPSFSCFETAHEEGVYVVDKCKRDWRGSDPIVKRKCEEYPTDLTDPLMEAPVTDPEAKVTYRNRYCAECNEAFERLHSWTVNVGCESLAVLNESKRSISEDFVIRNLIYSQNWKKWGVLLWSPERTNLVFHPCELIFELPAHLKGHARACRPNLVSSCDPKWRRDSTWRKCGSYMAAVYFAEATYLNPHCALCNFVDLSGHKCSPRITARKRPPLSFTLLLDVNTSGGNTVGVNNACPATQRYDPFFKKCRSLVCALPGYVMKKGKCVKGQ